MRPLIHTVRYGLTDSTNTRAKEYIRSGAERIPALFIADAQSAGRGRMGRSFYSPSGSGLYATLLFPAPEGEDKLLSLTSLAAVAAAEAIYGVLGERVEIKWVNDLYKDGKKVAGILAESFVRDTQRYIALGVGINLFTSEFPVGLSDKAGSLLPSPVSRRSADALALLFSERFLGYLESDDTTDAMNTYRRLSCVLGRRISFIKDGDEIFATAVDITPLGALVVRLDRGEELTLSTGEISIFLK